MKNSPKEKEEGEIDENEEPEIVEKIVEVEEGGVIVDKEGDLE